MKKMFMLTLFILLSFVSFAQEQPDAEMMQAWQAYMTPGEMHELLGQMVGEWNTEITMWMDPSAEPTKSTGTSVYKAILDGRYFTGEHHASFMNMPMIGNELVGYDNAKKKFFSTWIDNFGTGILYMEGTLDPETKVITYFGKSTDPMGVESDVKQTITYSDKDKGFMEMFTMKDGQEFKTMELTFTRTK
ncbi:MAG: DUF1579 domain-containing protein [Ignavibacteriaceae bacterium]|nr:DUF1579 domain-containing protein [Ignavibacteriaceae bacterium]